jgi:hypothetical protein
LPTIGSIVHGADSVLSHREEDKAVSKVKALSEMAGTR